MPAVCFSEEDFRFPPLSQADEEGLLLVGGRVTPERILSAYQSGIFPWYNNDALPLWWSPDPRFVLFPDQLHVSSSMKKVLRSGKFELKLNTAFGQVLAACSTVERRGQDGTWITPAMKETYLHLHQTGWAISVETWQDNQLVGGMYGISIGQVFFGESMFSLVSNASKFALISFVELLKQHNFKLLDCQVYTNHLESLGAQSISRKNFAQLLSQHASLSKHPFV